MGYDRISNCYTASNDKLKFLPILHNVLCTYCYIAKKFFLRGILQEDDYFICTTLDVEMNNAKDDLPTLPFFHLLHVQNFK